MDPQTVQYGPDWIIAGIAIVAAVGNAIAYFVARRELIDQRKETRDLARLTHDLEARIRKLSANLDQYIFRLDRVRDLLNGLMFDSISLRQQSRPLNEKLNFAVQREMTFPELDALVKVINDKDLYSAFQEIKIVLLDPVWPELWNEKIYDVGKVDELIQEQSRLTMMMMKRLLELHDQATKTE